MLEWVVTLSCKVKLKAMHVLVNNSFFFLKKTAFHLFIYLSKFFVI